MNRHAGRGLLAFIFIILTAVSALANADVLRMRLNTALRYVTMGWFHEAAQQAGEAVKASPQDPEAHMWLAMLQQVDGEDEAAVYHYDLSVSLDPDMGVLAVFMGDIRLRQGRLQEAAELYSEALAVDPKLGLAHYGLGRVLQRQGDPAARDAFEQGVEVAPDMVDLRYRLGKLLREAAEYESALEHLQRASLINPDLVHVRYELGLTYEALSNFSAAEHEYRTALRLDPEHELARTRLSGLSSI